MLSALGGGEAFRWELRRKAFHQLALLYLAAYFLLGWDIYWRAMIPWSIGVASLDFLRLKTSWGRSLAYGCLGSVIREKEAGRLSGASYMALGFCVTAGWFGRDPRVMTAAILCVAWCDALSSLVGMRFEFMPYTVLGSRRSLGGAAAGLAAATAIMFGLHFPPSAAVGAAIAFGVIDSVPVWPDDNLWIPIAVGAVLHYLA